MKILYMIHQFYPEHHTGTEKVHMNLATMMQKFGHKVKVLTYSFYQDTFYEQRKGGIVFKEFMYKGIPVLALRHKNLPRKIHYALDDKDLSSLARNFVRREKPDVVHVGHSMRVAELVKVLAPSKIPYLVMLTDCFLICPKHNLLTSKNTLCGGPESGTACEILCPEFPAEFITKRLEAARDILFSAHLVTTPSKLIADIFKKEFPSLDIKIINHGLRYSMLKKNRRTYTNETRISFCYKGSLNFHKGVHILVDSFKKVNSNAARLKIYGSGDESYTSQLMAMAKGDPRIEFCGVYAEGQTGDVLEKVDVVITPSLWYEAYCLVLHEAHACNLPVIASDIGVMAQKVTDGVNGFLFRVGDSRHLRQVLQKIVDDPTILNTMKQNINRIVIPSIEQEAHTYERAYVHIVREVANPRNKIDSLLRFR